MKPAIIAGVILGLVQAIPFLNFINVCCCLGAIGAGFLSVYLYNKANGSRGVTNAEGVTLGAMTGGIAAPIILILGVPLGLLTQSAMIGFIQSLNPEVQMPADAFGSGILGGIMSGLIWAVLCTIFATLGGLLGSLVFKPTGGPGAAPPPAYPGPGAPYGQGGPGAPYGQGGGQPY
jgi:hypothetical protein